MDRRAGIRNISGPYSNAVTIRWRSISDKLFYKNKIFYSETSYIILNKKSTRSSGAEPIVELNKASLPAHYVKEGTENSFYNNWTMNNTKGSYCPKLVRASWNSFVFYVDWDVGMSEILTRGEGRHARCLVVE